MGTYSHLTDDELTALRTRLVASLTDRLTAPTAASSSGRSVQFQQRTQDLRDEIAAVNSEISGRSGQGSRGPIYLIG